MEATSQGLGNGFLDRPEQGRCLFQISARLRFFITTNHTEAQIRATVSAVADELAKLQRKT